MLGLGFLAHLRSNGSTRGYTLGAKQEELCEMPEQLCISSKYEEVYIVL